MVYKQTLMGSKNLYIEKGNTYLFHFWAVNLSKLRKSIMKIYADMLKHTKLHRCPTVTLNVHYYYVNYCVLSETKMEKGSRYLREQFMLPNG